MQNHLLWEQLSLSEMQPYSKIIGSQGPLGIIISLYSSAWHSEKLSLGMESGTCILKAGNYFNLQALVAFSGHWLALSLWHPHLDWELLPCAPATFPSTWHKTCQKKNLSCPLCLHLGLIPLPSPCLYSTREIQCNSTQQATQQPPSDRENARSFKHQEKQGPVLRGPGIWEGKET